MLAFSNSERFDALDSKDRDRLDALSKLDQFHAGEEIASTAKPAEWVWLIMSGQVELRGGDKVLATLGPGDLFGELESFSQLGGLSYRATAETVCWALAKNPLKQELRVRRTLAAGLLSVYSRSISEKLRAANEALAHLPNESGLSRPPPPQIALRPNDSNPGEASAATGEAAPVRPDGPLGRPPHLAPEEAAWLSVLGKPRAAKAGEVIVHEGESGRSFFVVEKGRLEVRKESGGGETRTLAELADGDLFGFMAFVDKKPRSASVVATEECSLYEIEGGALDKALSVNFTVSFKFLGTLCSVLGRTFRDTARRVMLAN